MEIFIKETGKTEKQTALEYLLEQMAACTKEIGWMICITVKELSLGIIILYNMKEISLMERRQAKESLNLEAMYMKVILLMANFMEKESISLLRLNPFMKEISITTTSQARVKWLKLMDQNMKDKQNKDYLMEKED